MVFQSFGVILHGVAKIPARFQQVGVFFRSGDRVQVAGKKAAILPALYPAGNFPGTVGRAVVVCIKIALG